MKLHLLAAAIPVCLSFAPAPPANPKKLEQAVESIVTKLLTADEGICVGAEPRKAQRAAKGAANLASLYQLPIESTEYAPRGKWRGLVQFHAYRDEEQPELEEPVDEVFVTLFVNDYDQKKLARFVKKVAAAHGVKLETDYEDTTLLMNYEEAERDLWVAFGDELVAMSASLPIPEEELEDEED